jgi:outer membrane lipoprotein carrier protein
VARGKRNLLTDKMLRYDGLPMPTLLLALLPWLGQAPPPAADLLAETLLQRLEERAARTSDLVARFRQSYRSSMLGREVSERGVVSIKRPGRMRWEYLDPERKLFISDGRTFFFYVPADKQVIVSEQDVRHSLAARLLFGRGGLRQEFQPSLEEPLEEGVVRLKLVPRSEQPDVARAFVDMEPQGALRSIQLDDVQGNRTIFRFERLRENAGLADALFRFELPKGVEVIRG